RTLGVPILGSTAALATVIYALRWDDGGPPVREDHWGRGSGQRADHAFEQVVHVVEDGVVVIHLAFDDDIALIVLERADIDRFTRLEVGNGRVCSGNGFGRGARAIGRGLQHVIVVAAGEEGGQRFTLGQLVGKQRVDGGPLVFGAGDEAIGRQRGLGGIVAAGLDAATLGGFHHHLGAVDMAGDDIA